MCKSAIMNGELLPLRARNMSLRRQRILNAARDMIREGGLESISLRQLAHAAGVTVPTIYNLVGNKDELLFELFTDFLGEVEERIRAAENHEPLAASERLVIETARVFGDDETYFRAASCAFDQMIGLRHRAGSVARLQNWGEDMLTAGITACSESGLLNGRIPVNLIDQAVRRSFRQNLRMWSLSVVTIDEFRDNALCDIYIALAGDANELFRARLVRKLTAIMERRCDLSLDQLKDGLL
jgi:AcrR family transcriptional regulator